MKRKALQNRIESSADALIRAAIREIDRMRREGLSSEQILEKLRMFRLPSAEASKLQRVLEQAMDETTKSRSRVVKELTDADIETVKASTQISFPKLQSAVKSELIPTVQRAIASRMGPNALMHELKQKEFERPKTLALTSLSQFNTELTFAAAEVTGTETFRYSGPIAPSTRPFCRAHAGQVFTLAEIEKMDNGQDLPVRSSKGGYNCRHDWIPEPDGKPSEKSEVKVGKQTLLMDKERKNEFFSHERRAYIEAEKKFEFGSDVRSLQAARALASAHDGFNERITNQPADGVWVQRLRRATIDGEKQILTNFEEHVRRRKADGSIQTVNEYRTAMTNVLRDGNSIVFATKSGDGTLRYLVHNETTNWLVMLDDRGAVHTAFPRTEDSDLWHLRQRKGLLKNFIGEFK